MSYVVYSTNVLLFHVRILPLQIYYLFYVKVYLKVIVYFN